MVNQDNSDTGRSWSDVWGSPPRDQNNGCTNLTSELVFFIRKLIGMYVLAIGSINRLQERKHAIACPRTLAPQCRPRV
ncbi:hypothetical protein PVAP13_8KG327012 [Panicum virgatum]|uniref:Uncharacterized protein n=1 Tax=Panicum virgatum TaxID=38727 RepID=A0A8T0PSV0_PANVG|nr:hypothetical protein PVAP13_8KG327012 [Panicum virgatum]